MELVLTGDMLSANDAERLGLVNRVVPAELCLEEALNIAKKIAAKPQLAVKAAKEAVLKSANTGLDEGLEFERKAFYLLFASADRSEGNFSKSAKLNSQVSKPPWPTKRSFTKNRTAWRRSRSTGPRRSTPSCRR